MKRLFEEHFELPGEGGGPPLKRPRSVTKEGRSAGTLQNPSDPDAGYDGHKGAGYQAQIAQTLPPRDEDGDVEGPGLLDRGDRAKRLGPGQRGARGGPQESRCRRGAARGTHRRHPLRQRRQREALRGARRDVGQPRAGKTPKEEAKHNSTSAEKARRERLDERRALQETEEWKRRYAPRSGIEGVNRALDSTTGFKELRVRGIDAVGMALLLNGAGWNIAAAAKIKRHRRRKAELKAFGRTSRRPWGPWSPLRSPTAFANRLFAAIRPAPAPAGTGAPNGIFGHAMG